MREPAWCCGLCLEMRRVVAWEGVRCASVGAGLVGCRWSSYAGTAKLVLVQAWPRTPASELEGGFMCL